MHFFKWKQTEQKPALQTELKENNYYVCIVLYWNVLESVGHLDDRLKVILIDNGMKLKRMNLISNVDKCLENFNVIYLSDSMNSEIRIHKWMYIIIWNNSIFKLYKNTDLINVLNEN